MDAGRDDPDDDDAIYSNRGLNAGRSSSCISVDKAEGPWYDPCQVQESNYLEDVL